MLAFITSSIAFLFLIPGVSLSMLHLQSGGTVSADVVDVGAAQFGMQLFNTSNSILQTVQHLFRHDNRFVACMIFFFSIITPATKGILLTYILLTDNSLRRKKIFSFIKAIGKWSMCDVFIAATFLAYFSSGSRSHRQFYETVLLGTPVDVNILVRMTAHLETGFYCFLAYCLLSLIALQLYKDY